MRRAAIATGLLVGFVGTTFAADVEKGKVVYAARCAFCHGSEGKGDGMVGAALKPPPTNFASAEYWKAANAAEMKNVIKNGKPGTAMVSFAAVLSSDDIDNLADYVKTFAPK